VGRLIYSCYYYYIIGAQLGKPNYDNFMNKHFSPTAFKARLFVTGTLSAGQMLDLAPEQARRLASVLRLSAGDRVKLFNGVDGEWSGVIESLGKNSARVLLENMVREQIASSGPWLVFSPVKKSRLDMIIEKATELGVARLIPVITERTESRRVNLDRLRAQTIEAAEQCERLDIPQIDEPLKLEKLALSWPADRKLLVCAERIGAPPLATVLTQNAALFAILVGPEGGFEKGELDWIINQPISVAVGLGPRILRTETAAIAALTLLQALSGDWQ